MFIAHIDTSVSTSGYKPIRSKGLVQFVPPPAWCIIHTTSRLFESGPYVGWIPGFWWKLTDDVAGKVVVFPLKECSFEINVADLPVIVGS